ncbi:MAG: hypothetical protein H6622_17855 [Halobacteriovoraceae bacterium]|nr:hypothetical protein [Halobacteriovoraceae bacterium]
MNKIMKLPTPRIKGNGFIPPEEPEPWPENNSASKIGMIISARKLPK